MCAMQFVDDGRLTMVHLRLRGEALDDEVAEVIDVANRDVDLEIIDTSHVEHAEHLGQRSEVPVQPPESLSRVASAGSAPASHTTRRIPPTSICWCPPWVAPSQPDWDSTSPHRIGDTIDASM
jgi:hypothetical protein